MTLTASDVSSLARRLSDWEYAEYVACAFVAVACAGEYIADFTNWLTAGDERRKRRLAKRSTLLLIVSLAAELLCLVQTNSISGQLVGSLSDKATNADTKAQSALNKSTAVGKQYEDLLAKYTAAEREVIDLKAAKLPRHLSSGQQDILRKKVVGFSTKTIVVSCAAGMDAFGEVWDFKQDFVHAFETSTVKSEGQINCSRISGPIHIPPLQIEIGADRKSDARILILALEEIGIKKGAITIKPNANKSLLVLSVGPKNQ